MAETLSPNPSTAQKQRMSMANRIQSPTSPFLIGSNNDKLERAQVRAARAAAIRRKSAAAAAAAPAAAVPPCLGKDQILDLFHNCIKLSSENKINQKNTWELGLIDHLGDIIKVEGEEDAETNFQKASCTLEAGVKIYSLRVDSVHTEAYKVLGGMNRAGQENEEVSDTNPKETCDNNGQEEGQPKGLQKKVSPLSMLEPTFEALNVKKFDVAFAVDPLYHQTSAQFDEGGAKGLLLNNLGIYGECRVLFDSLEVPGKCMSLPSGTQHNNTETINLSFISDCIGKMMGSLLRRDEISPTIRTIVNQFDEDNQRPSDMIFSGQNFAERGDAADENDVECSGDSVNNCGSLKFDHDDQPSVEEYDFNCADPSFPSHHEENGPFNFQTSDMDERSEKVDEYVLIGLGLTSKRNAWAGPDHWKYQKAECLEKVPTKDNGLVSAAKRSKNRKQVELVIDFTKPWDEEMLNVFAPPKNNKTLLLPANRVPPNTKLPEDCHYQPENLVKLFLLPNVMCLGKRGRKHLDEPRQDCDDEVQWSSWDDQNEFGDQFDNMSGHTDVEDPNDLVSQPRKVNKIEVQYDKTSKQVDVQVLKETLWDCIKDSMTQMQTLEAIVSFKHILASIPSNCRATPVREDISPHLCFICLLHLANEHGLSIHGCADLDELSIHLPSHQGTEVK